MREHIAVKEAQKLNIPIFAMVDTNSDPRPINYVIPSNDDASKSINIILTEVTNAIAAGLEERKSEKQAEKEGVSQETAAPSKAEVVEKVEEEKVVTAKAPKEEKAEAPQVNDTPEPVKDDAAVISEKKEKAEVKKAVKADADDLTKIEGIGPKAAEALSNAGIDSYAKLAKANADKIKEILTEASSRMAHLDPGSWPKQAKMAADGNWDELQDWQEKAKGGVE